ncbi:unnamed protein product [Caenorhabditis angaria]|uniref:Uncharacterized protein n=1 Tax=Caenorhabditis angaria TaxID=860376 RepID=A0A9P1N4S3_9PELO|nr:unnamed protein product [Caenorhabditis angaria]
MMAQSSIEYGGNTLKDFDTLDAIRKLVPRPSNLPRDRLEDDEELDREPIVEADSLEGQVKAKDGEAKGKAIEKQEPSEVKPKPKRDTKSPFRRVELKPNRKRAVKNEEAQEQEQESSSETDVPPKTSAANPFEEIATRGPPRDYLYMKQLRNRHRKNRKRNRRRYRKHGFLSRDDILKAKPNPEEAPSVKMPEENTKAKAEFEQIDIRQKTWEREMKATEEKRKEMEEKAKLPPRKPEDEELEEEILKDPLELRLEAEEKKKRGGIGKDGLTIKRLPNNPYRDVDIRKPTVIELPIPPGDDEEENLKKN